MQDPNGLFLGLGSPLLGYVGLGPGELLPYFTALAGVIGAALIAIVQLPLALVIRWLKGKHGDPHAGEAQATATADLSSPGYETGGDGTT